MEKHLYEEHYELQEQHWWFLGKKKIIKSFVSKYVPTNTQTRVLDAGCGTGLMLEALQNFGEVRGMDFSEDAINFCRIKHGDNVRRGWFPDNVIFEKNHFNLVVCLDVIEHIDDDKNSVKALYDLLVPGGTLVITVPALMMLWSKWDDLNEHKRRYNKKELEDILLQNGFELEKISYYNFLLFLPVLLIRYYYKLFNKESRSSDTDMPSKFVNKVLKAIFSFEATLLKFMNFPIGVSLIAVAKKPVSNSQN